MAFWTQRKQGTVRSVVRSQQAQLFHKACETYSRENTLNGNMMAGPGHDGIVNIHRLCSSSRSKPTAERGSEWRLSHWSRELTQSRREETDQNAPFAVELGCATNSTFKSVYVCGGGVWGCVYVCMFVEARGWHWVYSQLLSSHWILTLEKGSFFQ